MSINLCNLYSFAEHISQVVPSAEMIIEVSTEPYIAPVKHDIVAPVDSEIMGATDSVSQQTLSVASETPGTKLKTFFYRIK